MAKLTSKQIGEDIRELRSIVWDLTRAHIEYRKDVEALIKKWQRISCKLRFRKSSPYRQIVAAENALRAFLLLSKIAKTMNAGDPKGSKQTRQRTIRGRIARILSFAMKQRWQFTPRERDLMPELSPFEKRWGLRFPIPPQLPMPKEMDTDFISIQAARPVKILSESPHSIVLRVWPLSKQMVLAWIDGAIRNSEYVQKDKVGRIIATRAKAAPPQIETMDDAALKLTIALPCDLPTVHRMLNSRLSAPTFRFREISEAMRVGVLRDLYELTFPQIASKVFAGRTFAEPPRRLALQRYRTFHRLQRELIGH